MISHKQEDGDRAPGALAATAVDHVARLAHLELDAAERELMQRDLSRIIQYIAKLNELDTSDVEPTSHAVELPTMLRDDAVYPGLPPDRALANAPERRGDGFGVPKVIE